MTCSRNLPSSVAVQDWTRRSEVAGGSRVGPDFAQASPTAPRRVGLGEPRRGQHAGCRAQGPAPRAFGRARSDVRRRGFGGAGSPCAGPGGGVPPARSYAPSVVAPCPLSLAATRPGTRPTSASWARRKTRRRDAGSARPGTAQPPAGLQIRPCAAACACRPRRVRHNGRSRPSRACGHVLSTLLTFRNPRSRAFLSHRCTVGSLTWCLAISSWIGARGLSRLACR